MNAYNNPFLPAPGNFVKSADSAVNTAVTLTQAAVNGMVHYVTDVEVYIRGAAAGVDITIDLKDGATTVYKAVIGAGAVTGAVLKKEFKRPVKMTRSSAVSVVVSVGGAGVISTVDLIGYTDRK